MKRAFQMTDEELKDMIAISQDKTPVMKIGDYWSGMDKQERANQFWKTLAKKYGFVWDTVEAHPSGEYTRFMAKPIDQ